MSRARDDVEVELSRLGAASFLVVGVIIGIVAREVGVAAAVVAYAAAWVVWLVAYGRLSPEAHAELMGDNEP